MLVNVTATTKNINLKSEYPTVDKTIDTDKKGDSAQIGSKVNFQLKSKVPDTSEYTNYVFKIVDTPLSAGGLTSTTTSPSRSVMLRWTLLITA